MSANISFRPITEPDARILGTALSAIDPWAHYHYTADALSRYLALQEDGAPHFAILAGGVLAGTICIRKNWLRGPYLQLLGILPAFQKQGIGGAALRWFEAEARREAVSNIWVVASAFNPGALSLYERFGFDRVATLDDLVANGDAEILLRKRLTLVDAPPHAPRVA